MAESKGNGKEVAATSGGTLAQYPILGGKNELLDTIADNLGGQGIAPLDLDRVGIPPGGATQWQIPTLEGEESVKELEGIIVAWQAPRVFWEMGLDESGGGQPPDCSSPDGEYGLGRFQPGSPEHPQGTCDSCPMNQWGSAGDGGRGKGCRELRALYMIRPGGILPIVVSAPPTSIVPIRKYMVRLAAEAIPYYGVVTALALEQQSQGAFRWSTVKPRMVARLTADETEQAQAYGKQLADQLPRSSATPPPVAASEE